MIVNSLICSLYACSNITTAWLINSLRTCLFFYLIPPIATCSKYNHALIRLLSIHVHIRNFVSCFRIPCRELYVSYNCILSSVAFTCTCMFQYYRAKYQKAWIRVYFLTHKVMLLNAILIWPFPSLFMYKGDGYGRTFYMAETNMIT